MGERRERLQQARLCFVVEARPHGRDPGPLLRAALRGGVDVVQLRDLALPDNELLAAGAVFRRVCDEHGALFIVSGRPVVARAVAADGVHIEQREPSLTEARKLAGNEWLVGLSTSSGAEIAAADYLFVGPVFATPTKPRVEPVGLPLVREAARSARIPFFAIGGIDETNVADVAGAGAPAVAVIRAIRDAPDPEAAARVLRAALAAQSSGCGAAHSR